MAEPDSSEDVETEAETGSSLPPRPPKRRRHRRTVYSVEQREELERFFQNNHYPSYDERESLAARLDLQEQQVQVWFKNRRAKFRKMPAAAQQPRQAADASTQGPGVGVPAPAAADPGFLEDLDSVLGPELSGVASLQGFSGQASAPGKAASMGGPGFYNLPPPNVFQGVIGAEASASSHMQAWWGPTQESQNPVPATAAAVSTPAAALVGSEDTYTSGFYSSFNESPTLADLLSSQGPLGGPSSLQGAYPKDEASGGEDDPDSKKLLDL